MTDMRNVTNVCFECGSRIPPGAPVAIVHTWQGTPITRWVRNRGLRPSTTYKRSDHWVCLECARSSHRRENDIAETGRCETCDREIRHWDYSQPMPTACCADCRHQAANKRSRERRRVQHAPMQCAASGEMFTRERSDAVTCSNKCRQAQHRERDRSAHPLRRTTRKLSNRTRQ